MNDAPHSWPPLRTSIDDSFRNARLELHYAVQLIAAAGQARVPARPDDSHRGFVWEPESAHFLGEVMSGPEGHRVALEPRSLVVSVLQGERSVSEFSLGGHTRAEANRWLAGELGLDGALAWPDFEIGTHALATGAHFGEAGPDSRAVGDFYAAAHAALSRIRGHWNQASAPRVWPHHFDLASLLPVGEGETGEHARSVGIGLSPGDGTCDEPYWYVSPWPYPDASALGALPRGHWHTTGFTAAILPASEMPESEIPESETGSERQSSGVMEFLETGVERSLEALAG